MTHRRHHDLVDEQTNDDRRRTQQNVVDEPHDRGQPVMAAVLGHIGSRQDADRGADENREHREDQAADDRIEQAAGGTRWRRHFREHGHGQPAQPFPDQGAEDEHQPSQAENGGQER